MKWNEILNKRKGKSMTNWINQDWLKILQEKGFRITKPLRIITDILASSNHILNPTQVYLEAREEYPKIGLVTVYRTMEKLEEAGLIERVHMPDGCQSFFQAAAGHQHLLICTKCSKAEYFEGDNLGTLFNRTGQSFGYEITNHWLQLFGLCQDCQLKQTNNPT